MTPCDCVEGCQLADRFTPATRELMVFTKSAKRYFDLDAVREPYQESTLKVHGKGGYAYTNDGKAASYGVADEKGGWQKVTKLTHAGAPPLDWWKIDPDIPYTPQHEGEQMPATFYVGDAIEVMGKLPENSVDLILTSPPFLALRSYLPADHPDKALEGGSQSTPGEFIDWLLDVAEACDRVLAPHGSLCIELGDTYSGTGSGATFTHEWDEPADPDDRRWTFRTQPRSGQNGGTGWPLAKSLSLIPESFRFAMVYGFNPHTGRTTEPWRLRNVIRWVRPNPPVGALGDKFRPATSELMVFCKSAKRYFDLDAVREPFAQATQQNMQKSGRDNGPKARTGDLVETYYPHKWEMTHAGAPPLDWWNIPLLEGEEETRYGPPPKKPYDRPNFRGKGHAADPKGNLPGTGSPNMSDHTTHPLGTPPLDWWEIPPGGYEGAHYAVFPPELCVKPVKAMCPERVCKTCGEPSRRIVEVDYTEGAVRGFTSDNGSGRGGHQGIPNATRLVTSQAWSDCGHDDWRPGLVLDPFAGSGTTLAVATGHGRDAIGIDLDSRNFDLALERVGPFILTRGDIDERLEHET